MNLYWSVYKNLEKEVLELSNQVHFDDNQLSIYSVKISELLIRCAVEIEAISKDLFFKLQGTMPSEEDLYFDTDCLQILEEKWFLSKKKLVVAAPNCYFQDEKNRILTPLHKANKRGTSGCDWKQAYQAVKHNRTVNLKKGNLKHLLRALAALFILNVYFKDEVYDLNKDSNATTFPLNMNSGIFAIKLHKWTGYDGNHKYLKREDFDECIYLTKFKDESLEKQRQGQEEVTQTMRDLFFKHPKFLRYIETNNLQGYKGSNLMWDVLGKDDYVKISSYAFRSQMDVFNSTEYEAVLNKDV